MTFPIVGILAEQSKKHNCFKGESSVFKEIQCELTKQGGLSYVFTHELAQLTPFKAWKYDDRTKGWLLKEVPLPSVIYNRVPSRRTEKRQERPFKDIPMFNKCFFNKWETLQRFNQHPFLKNYTPDTVLIDVPETVFSFLTEHSSCYLKPAWQSRGIGIKKIVYHPENKLFTILSTDSHATISTYPEAYKTIEALIRSELYLLQEEIISDTLDGNKYDLRVLAISTKGSYSIIGIGGRMAKEQKITTHLPNGGELFSISLIKDRIPLSLLRKIVEETGKTINQAFGPVGEFSLDIGLEQESFHPFIYEANSKPMRFDEQEIQEKRIQYLIELFFEKSNAPISR